MLNISISYIYFCSLIKQLHVTLLIIFFLVSISFSFLCSILEAVLLSVNPSYVTQQVQQGSATGKLLSQYKDDIDKPLSAILTLNTIAHTAGAIGVGAMATSIWGASVISTAVVPVVMTLAILILSEIIPKTIGANNWKSLAPFTTKTLRLLIWILGPLVWLCQLTTKFLKKDKSKSVLSRQDFAAMAAVGETSGAIDKEESAIINNLLNFEKMTVRDIMTPRTVAYMVDENMTVNEFVKSNPKKVFSRIPVYSGDKDKVVGTVLKDDILACVIENGSEEKIKDLMLEANSVLQTTPLPEVFKGLTKNKQHLSVVKDEYGSVVGLVTMEDVFETLLGQEIMDESDQVIDMQQYARQKYGDKT